VTVKSPRPVLWLATHTHLHTAVVDEQASPLLSALAQQDVDTAMQRGPAGLVCEEGQEVRTEGRCLGASVTFALGRKEAGMVPTGSGNRLALVSQAADHILVEPPGSRDWRHFLEHLEAFPTGRHQSGCAQALPTLPGEPCPTPVEARP
jgi:hypothetical protein